MEIVSGWVAIRLAWRRTFRPTRPVAIPIDLHDPAAHLL